MKNVMLASVAVVVVILLVGFLAVVHPNEEGNPHSADWLDKDMVSSLDTLKRIDKEGMLYEMDCDYEYYENEKILELLKQYGIYDAGCSAFVTWNENGDGVLTARNYDYRHTTATGEYTGLNVAIHCSPEGMYRSIAIADAYWLDPITGSFCAGVLDDGKTDISNLVLLPYVCMDGLNEKGVSVSILKLDIKDGESAVHQTEAGKINIGHSVLMRYILDSCSTVGEAVRLAESYNIQGAMGMDFHIFVTDSTGASVVLEWRNNILKVTETNAVSNFYSGFDDAGDYVKNGQLIENFVSLENSVMTYHYGYGHGYHRFTGIVSALERYIDFTDPDYATKMTTRMTSEQAMRILSVAAQDPGTEATSMTQYSLIYDAKNLTATVCMHQDYDNVYTIKL